MHLTLTQYLDTDVELVAGALDAAVVDGLDAAAERIGAERDDVTTETFHDGLRVDRGLGILEGSRIRVGGSDRLAVLEFTVPWSADDGGGNGTKLLASNAFANTIAARIDGQVAAAA
jgi:hypothetical protein